MLFTHWKREEYRRESNLPPLLDNQPSPRRSRQLNVTQTSLWYINKKIIRDKNVVVQVSQQLRKAWH